MSNSNKNSNAAYIAVIAVLAVAIIGVAVWAISSGMFAGEKVTEPQKQSVEIPEKVDLVAQNAQLLEGLESTKVNVVMTDGQSFTMAVYPDIAPITVENFLGLVSEGFYDGLTFHRVIEGFMAQGGDPLGNGTGGSDKDIKGEFSSNGVENPLSHQRGVVSMARSNEPDSASSQFFICYADASKSLDGNYAAFGVVTEGMEVVDSFLSAGTDESDKPLKEVKIEKMTIVE